jgi:hypothetical protein
VVVYGPDMAGRSNDAVSHAVRTVRATTDVAVEQVAADLRG